MMSFSGKKLFLISVLFLIDLNDLVIQLIHDLRSPSHKGDEKTDPNIFRPTL